MKRWKIKLVAGTFIILICIVLFFYGKITTITIEGNQVNSTEEIKQQLFNHFTDSYSITLYFKYRLLEPKKVPFIHEYIITWKSFKHIQVQIYEKSIVACVRFMNEYVFFDREGTVLESSNQPMDQVPIIEGVKFKSFTINQKMDIENEQLLPRILNLSESINHYSLKIDRIIFTSQNEVVIYQGKVKVYLGDKERYDEPIAALSDVLQLAENNHLQGEIDMRNYSDGGKIILKQNKEK